METEGWRRSRHRLDDPRLLSVSLGACIQRVFDQMFVESSSVLSISEVHNCRILTPRSWAGDTVMAKGAPPKEQIANKDPVGLGVE